MSPHFILLDASYFLFFRYNATKRWWSLARRDEEPVTGLESDRYKEKFVSTFTKALDGLPKLVGWKKGDPAPIIMATFDCPRDQVWRRGVYPEYKSTRGKNSDAAEHFALVRQLDLFNREKIRARLSLPGLEGDDCIALTTEEIRKKSPDAIVTIVSSDGDFKQLIGPNVRLMDLKGKQTRFWPSSEDHFPLGNPDLELFCKIVSGDGSDNIGPIHCRCGAKTALRLFMNKESFADLLVQHPGAAGLYERNRLLIDFKCIPRPLVDRFRRECLRIL